MKKEPRKRISKKVKATAMKVVAGDDIATIETKHELNEHRIAISEKKAEHGKLGVETLAIQPEDLKTMFVGKACNLMLASKGAVNNIMWAYFKKYFGLDDAQYKKVRAAKNPLKALKEFFVENYSNNEIITNLVEELLDLQKSYSDSFEGFKNKASKIAEKHELWKRMDGIRGFTPYQLALLMAHIKDIARFDSPSQLFVYSGVGSVGGMAVSKRNIARIKEYYFNNTTAMKDVKASDLQPGNIMLHDGIWAEVKSAEPDAELKMNVIIKTKEDKLIELLMPEDADVKLHKEFKGFNTELAGRMFVIAECLIRARGFFSDFFARCRTRMREKAINEGTVELIGDKWYLKGRNKQSLDLWTMQTAKRKVATLLLDLVYVEWRTIKGLPVREPYQHQYLGHTSLITLAEVIAHDKTVSVKNKPSVEADEDSMDDDV